MLLQPASWETWASNGWLLTNNGDKVAQLRELGLDIVEQVPLLVGVGPNNHQYLATKAERMGHTIALDDLDRALGVGVATERTDA